MPSVSVVSQVIKVLVDELLEKCIHLYREMKGREVR